MSLQTRLSREPRVTDGAFPSPVVAVNCYEVVLNRLVVDADEVTAVGGACEVFGVIDLAVLLQRRGFGESFTALVAMKPETCT